MKSWLKRFFGSFFYDKFATDNAVGGAMVTVIGLFLTFAILFFSLFGGYMAAFGSLYSRSREYNSVVKNVFDGIGEIRIADGYAYCDKVVDTFASDDEFSTLGYAVIVDTRPFAETFGEFTPYYLLKSEPENRDKLIYAEEYFSLTAEQKNEYVLRLERIGEAVDTLAGVAEYEEYFEGLTEDNNDYRKLNNSKLDMTEKAYADELYVLYIKTLFPEIAQLDPYGDAPMLRTYYIEKLNALEVKKYLAVFDNCVIGEFFTDGGMQVDFAGAYGNDTANYSDGSLFITSSFYRAAGVILGTYFVNSISMLLLTLFMFVIVCLINFIACKLSSTPYGMRLGGSVNAVGALLFMSAMFTGILILTLSFCVARYTLFNIAPFVFGAILLARTLVLFVMQYIKARKERATINELETEETEQTEIRDQNA